MHGHIIGSVFSSLFFFFFKSFFFYCSGEGVVGWCDGAKVLGKLSVSERPTNLNYSRARAYCAYRRCG